MFTTSSNLLSKSGLTADQCDRLLAGHGDFEGLGQAFIDIENRDGVNAFWSMAQGIQEVGWSGHSAIADDKKNLFGITAYDSNPYGDASSYNSYADCVEYYGDFIKSHYLTPGGAYYVSATPAGVARHWASDPNYASEVVSVANVLLSRVGGSPTPAPAPVPTPSGAEYTVQSGDNLSAIAQKVGLTLGQLESMNPGAGHPAGNYNVIWPGDTLHVGAVAPPSAPTNVYIVQSGDTLSGIASRHGVSLGELEKLNPEAGHPAGNFNVIWPGDRITV